MSDSSQGPGWWQASDGKWYPPQDVAPPPPPNMPPPQPPSYLPPPQPSYQGQPVTPPQSGMSGCLKGGLIVGGILLVLGLGSCVVIAVAVDDATEELADEIDRDRDAEQERESRDVSEPTCQTDEIGFMEAELTVTNQSSERSNYIIEVTFEAPDGSQLDTGTLLINSLEPGQSRTDTAGALSEPDGEFTCRVVEVSRFSDEP